MNKTANQLVRGDVVFVGPHSTDRVASMHILSRQAQRAGDVEVIFGSGKTRCYPQGQVLALRENQMNTCQMFATELDVDVDVITDLAWDIACQDLNLTTDYFRLAAAPFGAANPLADIQISDALVVRIKDALDTSSDAVTISLLAVKDAAENMARTAAHVNENRAARSEAIRAARAAGATVSQIMSAAGIARQTAYDAL